MGVELLRSACEILSWYLHWRRLPWFALIAFALAIFNIAIYESSHTALSLISGSLSWGIGTYMAAMHYLELGRHQQSAIEKRWELEAMERWMSALTPQERSRLNRLCESLYLCASAGTIPAETVMKTFSEAMATTRKRTSDDR